MRYTIYKTTNLINGKFYIGMHATQRPDDSYLGSGSVLRRAIKKYGKASFRKEVLFDFDSFEEMVSKEREIVTKTFKDDPMTYNLREGGKGGWGHMSTEQLRSASASGRRAFERNMKDPDLRAALGQRLASSNVRAFQGRKHSEATLEKLSDAGKLRAGGHNSQHGTVWVCREGGTSRKVDRALLAGLLADGWNAGRVPPRAAPQKRAALNEPRDREIQALYSSGVLTQGRLALKYGISQSHVGRIVQDVPRPPGRQGPPRKPQ